jgi:hypothetical protein
VSLSYFAPVDRIANSSTLWYPRGAPLQVNWVKSILVQAVQNPKSKIQNLLTHQPQLPGVPLNGPTMLDVIHPP